MQQAAKNLAALSAGVAVTSLVCMSALAAILVHWHDALNTCTDADCGCLLYARAGSTTYTITGADISLCWFAGLAPLPGFVVAVGFAAFYGYRGCIRPPRPPRSTRDSISAGRLLNSNGATRAVVAVGGGTGPSLVQDQNRRRATARLKRNTALFTVQCMVCGVWGLLAVAHVAVLMDGYFEACHEYRKAVQKTLSASGSLAVLVNERLGCTVIFDFLDYMKPDAREHYGPHYGPGHWFPGERKLTTINTAAALVISIMTACAHMVLWFALSGYSGVLARQYSRRVQEHRRTPMFVTSL